MAASDSRAQVWRTPLAISRVKRGMWRKRSLQAALYRRFVAVPGEVAGHRREFAESESPIQRASVAACRSHGIPPVAQRDAIVLHYWQGCTLAETADRLDRTAPAVAGLLHRGLKKLRSAMDDGTVA